MAHNSVQRYQNWYAKLLQLYPKAYRERFGAEMMQIFTDLFREHTHTGRGILSFVMWIFTETVVGIIRENITGIIMQKIHIIRPVIVTALLLLIPLISMQFSDEMTWSGFDFVIAAVLLLGAGLAYEFISKRGSLAYRFAVAGFVFTTLLLIWVNGAVGLIGSEDNPANVLYGGVIAVGLIGAIISHLQARGMSRTLFTMAVAQIVVPVIAMLIWKPGFDFGLVQVFGVSMFFTVLWVASGLLFQQASDASVK